MNPQTPKRRKKLRAWLGRSLLSLLLFVAIIIGLALLFYRPIINTLLKHHRWRPISWQLKWLHWETIQLNNVELEYPLSATTKLTITFPESNWKIDLLRQRIVDANLKQMKIVINHKLSPILPNKKPTPTPISTLPDFSPALQLLQTLPIDKLSAHNSQLKIIIGKWQWQSGWQGQWKQTPHSSKLNLALGDSPKLISAELKISNKLGQANATKTNTANQASLTINTDIKALLQTLPKETPPQIHIAKGTINLTSTWQWQQKHSLKNNQQQDSLKQNPAFSLIKSIATLKCKNVSATWHNIKVNNLNTTLPLTLYPKFHSSPSKLTLANMNNGWELSKLEANYQFDSSPKERWVLRLTNAKAQFAGGTVTTRNVIYHPQSSNLTLTLNLSQIDIAILLRKIEMDGLSGTGTLSGKLPLTITPQGILIKDGQLRGATPGTIIYNPTKQPSFATGEAGLEMLLKVVKNFHFKSLSIQISKETAKETQLQLHIKGANPDYYSGTPVNLNLNLSLPLQEMLHFGLSAWEIEDYIKKKVSLMGNNTL